MAGGELAVAERRHDRQVHDRLGHEAGDEVLAMVTPESEDEVRRILTGASL